MILWRPEEAALGYHRIGLRGRDDQLPNARRMIQVFLSDYVGPNNRQEVRHPLRDQQRTTDKQKTNDSNQESDLQSQCRTKLFPQISIGIRQL